MPYKRGRPLIDTSWAFRAASTLTFYPIWTIAQMINILTLSTSYENRKKLSSIPKAFLVSNHTAFLDPVMISGAMIPRRTWHTLLGATVEAPFLGTFTRLLGGIPIPTGKSGYTQLLDACRTAFRYRRFIHFYPEGECYLYNQVIKDFKPGAFILAAELDVPVVPLVTVYHEGRFKAGSFWGRILRRSLPRETCVVLDPVYPADFVCRDEAGNISKESVRHFSEAVRKLMQDEIDRRGGSSAYFRGRMERIRGIND